MNRERLSIICAVLGGIGTCGLIGSGMLVHYHVLPLVGTLTFFLIGCFAILGCVGIALSVLFALPPMGREARIRRAMKVVYGVSLAGSIISFIAVQNQSAPWWLFFIFGVVLVASSLLLPVVNRRRKQRNRSF
jgi:hypothetical protein